MQVIVVRVFFERMNESVCESNRVFFNVHCPHQINQKSEINTYDATLELPTSVVFVL